MISFTSLFLELSSHKLNPSEQEIVSSQLKIIYGGSSIAYNKDSDFEVCKKQLLALLDYFIETYPQLTLFNAYKNNIKELRADSPKIDRDITLKGGKTSLENALLDLEKNHEKMDIVAFNNYIVSACYQGAYLNLTHALNNSRISFNDIKTEMLLLLAAEYLKEKGLVDGVVGSEIHYARALVNFVAAEYGVDELPDAYAPNIDAADLIYFRKYVKQLDSKTFMSLLAMRSPKLPSGVLDMEDPDYTKKTKELRDFFEWLGEDELPEKEYLKLYQRKEGEEAGNYYFRLVPKPNFKQLTSCLVAEYFEKKGYLEGVTFQISNQKFIDSGEAIVRLTDQGGYQTLSQEDVLYLLEKRPENASWLLRQLSTKNLVSICIGYIKLNIHQQEALYLQALLERPSLEISALKTVGAHIFFRDNPNRNDQKALLTYLFTHPCPDLSPGFFNYVFDNTFISKEVLIELLFSAIKNDLVLPVLYTFQHVKYLPDLLSYRKELPLHNAVRYGALGVIDSLIQNKFCRVNEKNEFGHTVMRTAIESGQIAVLKTLKALGADLNALDDDGLTPAHLAAKIGDIKALEMLHELGVDFTIASKDKLTPAAYAVSYEKSDVLVTLKKLGVNLNQSTKGSLPLAYLAASKGNTKLLEVLHQLEVDLNIPLIGGSSPARIAVENNNFAVLCTLQKLGVDLERRNNNINPVYTAVYMGKPDMLRFLYKNRVDLHQVYEGDYSLAHIAVLNNQPEMLEVLYELGADLNQEDDSCLTPADYIAFYGKIGMLQIMHSLGVDLNKPNTLGKTPADIARSENQSQVLEVLDKLGVGQTRINESKKLFMNKTEQFFKPRPVSVSSKRLNNDVKDPRMI